MSLSLTSGKYVLTANRIHLTNVRVSSQCTLKYRELIIEIDLKALRLTIKPWKLLWGIDPLGFIFHL